MSTTKLDKVVPIGWGKGRGHVTVLREHYLRDDIPCHYQNCPICDQSNSTNMLLGNASHYVIPDGETLCQYQEVFQHPSLTGVIATQTAVNMVRDDVGRRSYRSLINSLTDPQKDSVVFDNEHQLECYCIRREKETLNEWRNRLHMIAVVWYINHLEMAGAGHLKIVLITKNIQEYERQLSSGCYKNVEVMSLSSYVSSGWCSHIVSLPGLYESLMAAKEADQGTDNEGFTEYLSLEEIKRGIVRGKYVTGSLRVSRYHPRDEAYVTPLEILTSSHFDILEESRVADILIPGMSLRNRSIHGDTVAIELLPRTHWSGRSKALPSSNVSHDQSRDKVTSQPTGRVVAIITRNNRDIVATFPEFSSSGKKERVLVIPYDRKLPKIRVATSLVSQLKDHRIVVRIDKWEVTSRYPEGHFIRTIGPIGNIETEIQSILIEEQLSVGGFGPLIMAEQPEATDWRVDPLEVTRRSDLRHTHLIFSIDPKGCEDVDDAMSIRTLKNGNIELGVHIADVSHFVRPGSHTDREAKERSTTVYLADRRYDMLPPVLSANLCSLHSNVDRYAVSVIWVLSQSYEVLKVWYGKTIIKSAHELSYEVAQDLLNGVAPSDVLPNIKELNSPDISQEEITSKLGVLTAAVKQLVGVARVLKERRDSKGALELEGVEVKVQLGEGKSIEDLIPKQPLEMHEVVAECMIFANHWLAKKLYDSLPSRALLRHHPAPQEERFEALRTAAASKGHSIDTSNNMGVANSLNLAQDPGDPQFNRVLRMLATHAMPQANYFSTGSLGYDQYCHYGLALDLYTHFTSPIRRYADLIVHRQLMEALGGKDQHSLGDKQLFELCGHMNKKKRSSQLAQIASTGLFQALYFLGGEDGNRCVGEAIIYNIRNNGVMAFIPRYGIQAPVYLKDKNGLVVSPCSNGLELADGTISHTDHYVTVTHPSGQYTLRLFDHILVKIRVEHGRAHPYSFALELLSCTTIHTSTFSNTAATRHELVKAVQSETVVTDSGMSGRANSSPYSTDTLSLYRLIQDMKTIGMASDTVKFSGRTTTE